MDRVEYAKLKQGGYKKGRIIDTEAKLDRVCHYLSTHTCYEHGQSTVRYLGKMSYNQLACIPGVKRIENVYCEICGAPLEEYFFDDLNNKVLAIKNKHVTRIIQDDVYYRGDDPVVKILRRHQRLLKMQGDGVLCLSV